ncbi:MAG TPA: beta-phosphoglucomutase family hydrolase [Actinomycetota bacterium]|nr:beta-phosphoglucomutase family hydrolase [Actinomycetota bacterium]
MSRLGLPEGITACLFDLDGVITSTASLHFQAWKQMFDEYLRVRAELKTKVPVLFEMPDYLEYVDGKPRAEGVRSFLASRDIELPQGEPDDPPGSLTVQGLGNRKNDLVLQIMMEKGVEAFEGSRTYLQAVEEAGLKRAVVSASTNPPSVLEACGLAGHFDTVVDGNVALAEGLRGKPFPDTFLHAASILGVEPAAAAVFEDALAGVQAGRDGGFGYVVGVDRGDQAEALRAAGADVVVQDLAELLQLEPEVR